MNNNNQEADERAPRRFDYSTYMQGLHQKLAEHHPGGAGGNWGHPPLGSQAPLPHLNPAAMTSPDKYAAGISRLQNQQEVLEKNDRFRDKILAKLGNVEDSKEHSAEDDDSNFAGGLQEPSDMEMDDDDGAAGAPEAGYNDHYAVQEQADEQSAESPDQYQKRRAL